MLDFWLDTDSFIQPKDGPYGFDIAPGFWDFLKKKAREGIIASSSEVYKELKQGEDDLLHWARQQQDEIGFFTEPDPIVQTIYREIAAYVNKKYPQHQSEAFLTGADAWIIAHAKAYGGRVVTFEKAAAPNSRKAKIPDVAANFGVNCLNVYEMVRDLGMRI